MSNTIRFLATDMVQSANSGHPGAPMGLADIATVLTKHLKINPKNPKWMNRDRVVFSGGHASSLIYSLLHLWGFEDVTLDDLKNFRQLGYKTEGHPEANKLEGVEITTGPLGQGVANAVGFSMASLYMKKLLGEELIDHKVYCFCGDGDLEEGISYEASSLAGHLELKNLVLIYDSNRITIEGDTCKAWSENVQKRFEAQGFEVLNINGHNFDEIEEAFVKTKTQTKPILIIANTIIAKGSANLEGSHKTHGAPLGDTEIAESKKLAGFNPDEKFIITDDVLARFRATCERGDLFEREWNSKLKDSGKEAKLNSYLNSDFTEVEYPEFNVGDKVATRDSNGKILNAIAEKFENFLGGSADLGPSNKTELKSGSYPKGQNIHFGIREHSMGAIGNAIASYGGLFPFTATFFVFSDYLKPSVRIASLMGAKQFFIWTHDSIGVGEDGPTHQPIEHLSQFRAMPNLYNFRPADAVENVISWKVALELNAPSSFILSRQGLKVFDKSNIVGEVEKGGYLIKKVANPKLTLLASGSEVELILEAGEKLNEMGIATNIVSVPCFDLFNEQEKSYKDLIIDSNSKVLAVEASSSLEWYKYADECILMESFGASAKAEELFKLFGFTVENVIEKAKTLI
jgi:transketolase